MMSFFNGLFNSAFLTFKDGSQIKELHRYALRYIEGEKYVDVGFEISVNNTADKILHDETINRWTDSKSSKPGSIITNEEKKEIISKIDLFCKKRRITYVRATT